MLNIDEDCEAEESIGQCKNFTATENYEEKTEPIATLQAGQKCTVTIDATLALGRVRFASAVNLGVLWNGYSPADPISVPMGSI